MAVAGAARMGVLMLFTKLRHRLLLIGLLISAAGLSLWLNHRRTASPDHPGQVVNLGLDLQGGIHLGLELDQSVRRSDDPVRDLDLALTVLRRRVDEFGVMDRVVQKVGDDRIVVELPGFRDPARAREVVQRTAFLEFRIADREGALERALPAMDRALAGLGPRTGPAATPATDVERLLGGDTASVATGLLSDLIVPTMAGGGGIPGEYAVPAGAFARVDSLLKLPEVRRLWPRGIDLVWSRVENNEARFLYALDERPVITGTSLVNATAQVDPLTNGAEVAFELNHEGGRRFGAATGRHVGDYLAILLDGRVQGRPPVIQSRIERQGRIQMSGRSLQEAQDLALVLRAGSLPTPLTIVEQYEIGPSLGEDSIRGGMMAGIVGTIAVIAIMVGYYAWSGVLAVVALGIYALLTFGTLALFGSTLTLPGLAGFVLSIGMAVDANVLIFERIREELDRGRTNRLAVAEGFRHAMPAVIDSNLTTVLTALFLFQFGTGPVQGFALTLTVGIFASMVTAVFVSRTLYQLWLGRRRDEGPLSVGGVRLFRNARFDYLRRRKWAYALTALMLLAGLGVGTARGVRSGVDFTGGVLHQIEARRPVDAGPLREALHTRGLTGAEVQRFGGANVVVVRTGATSDLPARTAEIAAAAEASLGAGQFSITRRESVGPKVGSEVRSRAMLAIALSFGAVLIYLAARFEWRYGLAAVIATAHDIAATLAFIAVLDLEVSLVVVAALLTVVGYSLNDTIVIFDRVRENQRTSKGEPLDDLLNRSVNETLPRTVLTGGTALATLMALAVFGGEVVRPFALVMFFGIATGTFSSIFVAAPVLRAIHRRWPRRTTPIASRRPAATAKPADRASAASVLSG